MLFCFKLKTAYELLISDLSSDVCSSDLRILKMFLRQGHVAAGRQFAHDLQPDLHRLGRRDVGHELLGGFELLALGAGRNGVRPVARIIPTVALGIGRKLGHAPLEVLDLRSEEHTSELQSLMRISYAV